MTKLIVSELYPTMEDLMEVEMIESGYISMGWCKEKEWYKSKPPCWFDLLNEIVKQPFGEVIWVDETF